MCHHVFRHMTMCLTCTRVTKRQLYQLVIGSLSPLESSLSYSGALEEHKAWLPQPFEGGVASGFRVEKEACLEV